jgi:hypothetical protein
MYEKYSKHAIWHNNSQNDIKNSQQMSSNVACLKYYCVHSYFKLNMQWFEICMQKYFKHVFQLYNSHNDNASKQPASNTQVRTWQPSTHGAAARRCCVSWNFSSTCGYATVVKSINLFGKYIRAHGCQGPHTSKKNYSNSRKDLKKLNSFGNQRWLSIVLI